jgi:hypothetical protein
MNRVMRWLCVTGALLLSVPNVSCAQNKPPTGELRRFPATPELRNFLKRMAPLELLQLDTIDEAMSYIVKQLTKTGPIPLADVKRCIFLMSKARDVNALDIERWQIAKSEAATPEISGFADDMADHYKSRTSLFESASKSLPAFLAPDFTGKGNEAKRKFYKLKQEYVSFLRDVIKDDRGVVSRIDFDLK